MRGQLHSGCLRRWLSSIHSDSRGVDHVWIGFRSYNCLDVKTNASVVLVQLNRPAALNALNTELMDELSEVLGVIDSSPEIKAAVLTGSEKSFAGMQCDMFAWSDV